MIDSHDLQPVSTIMHGTDTMHGGENIRQSSERLCCAENVLGMSSDLLKLLAETVQFKGCALFNLPLTTAEDKCLRLEF